MTKNRDIVNHGSAGKGDANRSPLNNKWRENYEQIEWDVIDVTAFDPRWKKRGGRWIKIYERVAE